MNQLETLDIPTEIVTFNGQSLVVRGLGLADITYIIREHRSVVADLYLKAIKGELAGSVQEIAFGMLADFIPLASMTIACALDSPKSSAKVAKLPLQIQVECLEKTFMLTLVGEGGLEKLLEIVVRAMAGAASLTSPKT